MWILAVVGISVLIAYCIFYVLTTRDANVIQDLWGKHVVITGGSSGIGKAAAFEAARLGAHVTVIGRDVSKLENTVKEIVENLKNVEKKDQVIQYAALDVTSDYDIIQKCFADLETKVGPIFMLVNCAGACICGLFENMEVQDIKAMVDLNYFGTALPTRAVLSKMRERDEGIVVFVSSEAALIGKKTDIGVNSGFVKTKLI